jgi:hypothetical protein
MKYIYFFFGAIWLIFGVKYFSKGQGWNYYYYYYYYWLLKALKTKGGVCLFVCLFVSLFFWEWVLGLGFRVYGEKQIGGAGPMATMNQQHPAAHHEGRKDGWMISGHETVLCWVPVP